MLKEDIQMQTVYRAGTVVAPSFEPIHSDEVWLIKNQALYYPLDQKGMSRHTPTRTTPSVCLWKAELRSPSKTLVIEDHPKFKGVCVIKGRRLQNGLRSLPWEPCSMPQCHGGMSVMDFNVIVQAVLEYMIDNPPTTPQEYNYQAELKAASHWDRFEGDKPLKLKPGPHDDSRIQKAASFTLRSWIKDLDQLKRQSVEREQSPPATAVKNEEESDSCDDIDDYVSELQRDIFSLRMYYKGTLKETDDDIDKYGKSISRADSIDEKVEELSLSPKLKRKKSPDDNISGPRKSPKTLRQSPRGKRKRSPDGPSKGFGKIGSPISVC